MISEDKETQKKKEGKHAKNGTRWKSTISTHSKSFAYMANAPNGNPRQARKLPGPKGLGSFFCAVYSASLSSGSLSPEMSDTA